MRGRDAFVSKTDEQMLRDALVSRGQAGKLDMAKEKDIIEKIVRSSRDTISNKISKAKAEKKLAYIESTIRGPPLREAERAEILRQAEEEETESLVKVILENYHEHSLKCGLLTVASKKIKADQPYLSKFVKYQMSFFRRRRIDPTMKEILKFNEAMQRFTKLIVRFTHFKDKNKLKYFARWYHQTFELRTEVRRMIKSKIEADFKDTSQREKLIREFFSTKNLFRLQARVFQGFSKWKMMMKYNYPFMNRKLSRVFGLIPNKVHELNRKMITDATAPVDRKMFERRVPRTKIGDLNLIDSISFYRKFTNGLYCLIRVTHRNLEELFVSFRLLEFPHENKNIKILEERHVSKKNLAIKPNGTRERPKVSEMVPTILAEQSFLNSYRRALVSGLKRLQSQVKISEKEHRLKEVKEQILNFRTRARVDLIRRVYSALYNRLQTRSLMKWHFQTEIRKAAGTRDEAKNQLMVKERALYTRIKEEVEQLATRYTVSLTRIVVRKLKDEKDDNMINLLKEELDKLVLELLDKL